MKINDIYTHQVSSFMYKYNANMLPINFINYFTKSSAVHVHNTRSADNFHLVFSILHYDWTVSDMLDHVSGIICLMIWK